MRLLDPEQYLFSLASVFTLVVGAAVLFLAIFVLLRERGSRIGSRFWFFHGTIGFWLVSFAFAHAARQEPVASWWFRLGTLGVLFIPPALAALTATVVRRERELRELILATFVVSLVLSGVLFGSDLFMVGLWQYSWGRYPNYGPLGFLFIIYFVSIVIASLSIFFRSYRLSSSFRNRRRYLLVLASIGIGSTASLDFAANLGVSLRPVGSISFAVYLLFMLRVALRYRLVEITPKLASGRILDTMQGAVVVVDLEGDIRLLNRAAEEMLGRPKADLLGKTLKEMLSLPPDGQGTSFEAVWTSASGRRFDVNVLASQLADEWDGRPLGTIYVAYDITERKEAEARMQRSSRQLQEANRKLEVLDRLKSDFVSTVSHELRTPLTSIKAFTEILLLKPDLGHERTERLLRIMNDESDRLGRLINDLLDLSRIEAGTQTWKSQPVSLNEIIRSSVDGILPLAQKKGLHLVNEVDGALPEIVGDRDRLVQVMTNLLSNAVKFTPGGGSIVVKAHSEGQARPRIHVSVSDTGMGIAPQELSLIFDKFHRAGDEEASMIDGTGLGLTIAREIVEHHGGSISATSMPGSGSTFIFTLPVDGERPSPAG